MNLEKFSRILQFHEFGITYATSEDVFEKDNRMNSNRFVSDILHYTREVGNLTSGGADFPWHTFLETGIFFFFYESYLT